MPASADGDRTGSLLKNNSVGLTFTNLGSATDSHSSQVSVKGNGLSADYRFNQAANSLNLSGATITNPDQVNVANTQVINLEANASSIATGNRIGTGSAALADVFNTQASVIQNSVQATLLSNVASNVLSVSSEQNLNSVAPITLSNVQKFLPSPPGLPHAIAINPVQVSVANAQANNAFVKAIATNIVLSANGVLNANPNNKGAVNLSNNLIVANATGNKAYNQLRYAKR